MFKIFNSCFREKPFTISSVHGLIYSLQMTFSLAYKWINDTSELTKLGMEEMMDTIIQIKALEWVTSIDNYNLYDKNMTIDGDVWHRIEFRLDDRMNSKSHFQTKENSFPSTEFYFYTLSFIDQTHLFFILDLVATSN